MMFKVLAIAAAALLQGCAVTEARELTQSRRLSQGVTIPGGQEDLGRDCGNAGAFCCNWTDENDEPFQSCNTPALACYDEICVNCGGDGQPSCTDPDDALDPEDFYVAGGQSNDPDSADPDCGNAGAFCCGWTSATDDNTFLSCNAPDLQCFMDVCVNSGQQGGFYVSGGQESSGSDCGNIDKFCCNWTSRDGVDFQSCNSPSLACYSDFCINCGGITQPPCIDADGEFVCNSGSPPVTGDDGNSVCE